MAANGETPTLPVASALDQPRGAIRHRKFQPGKEAQPPPVRFLILLSLSSFSHAPATRRLMAEVEREKENDKEE